MRLNFDCIFRYSFDQSYQQQQIPTSKELVIYMEFQWLNSEQNTYFLCVVSTPRVREKN